MAEVKRWCSCPPPRDWTKQGSCTTCSLSCREAGWGEYYPGSWGSVNFSESWRSKVPDELYDYLLGLTPFGFRIPPYMRQ